VTAATASIRAATENDLRAIDSVLRANHGPPPGEPMEPPGAQDPYLRHLIVRGTTAVAEVDGVVIGFGAAVFTGRLTHLADLFVLPAYQGQGHGGRLLAAVFGDRFPRTTFSSDDPRALPLYVRARMAPLWPSLYVSGDPGGLPADPTDIAVEDATLDDVARLEGEWAGVDRSPDVAFWKKHNAPRAVVVVRAGRPVAVGLSRGRLNGFGRWVDRALVAPDEDPVAPFIALIRRGADGGGLIGASVAGPSPLLPVLLTSGFRIRDRDTFMASDPRLVDPSRILANTGIL
jgi:GNAT superfamily N-acetyltransferase